MTEPAKTGQNAAIPDEPLENARDAKSADELASIIADTELDNVTGGGCGSGGDYTIDKCCPSCGSSNCTFTNEKVFAYDRHTFDGYCNSCGYSFTYVVG